MVKNYFVIAWHWLIYSSANPADTSLTIKGTLMAVAATLIPIWPIIQMFVHVPITSDVINQIIVAFVAVVQSVLILVGAVIAFVGLIRKILLTLGGKNQATNLLSDRLIPVSMPVSAANLPPTV